MLDPVRKERNLLGGLGVQLLIVALLVFAYTQAIRQVKHRGELQARLREQLAMAKEQMARQGSERPDVKDLQASVAGLSSAFIPHEGLEKEAQRMKALAQEEYGFSDLQVKVGEMPLESVWIPLGGSSKEETGVEPTLQIEFYPLELGGSATSRSVASLLARLSDPAFRPLMPLAAMDLKRLEPPGIRPVSVWLRWFVPVLPDSSGEKPPALIPPPPAELDWGERIEPFLPAQTEPSIASTESIRSSAAGAASRPASGSKSTR